MKDRVNYTTCTGAALDIKGAVVNATQAMRDYFVAAGVMHAPADAPVFFYRDREGNQTNRLSRGVLFRKLRSHIEPYNRVDLHILRDLAVYREAMQRGR